MQTWSTSRNEFTGNTRKITNAALNFIPQIRVSSILRRRNLKTQLFFLRLGVPSTLIRHEIGPFRKRFPGSVLVCLWGFRKLWRYDNNVIPLPEFSSNTNPKMIGDCCAFKFLQRSVDGKQQKQILGLKMSFGKFFWTKTSVALFINCAKHCEKAIKARLTDVEITWYPITVIQLQKVQIEHLWLDTHVIARRLRDKQVRGEPITIENFVI